MKRLPLYGIRGLGKFAIVDDELFDELNKHKWQVNHLGYASRSTHIKVDGKRKNKNFVMHRVVNSTPPGMDTDHINRNKLDNRKINLRTCSERNNTINRGNFKNNTTGYKGVIVSRNINPKSPFQAQLKINKKTLYLGSFDTSEEAAMAYNHAAAKHYGEYAVLNKIGDK